MEMATMVNCSKVASFCCNNIIRSNNSSVISHPKPPFHFQLGFRFPITLLLPAGAGRFHSTIHNSFSFSNHVDSPPPPPPLSRYQKVSNLDDALKLFDKMSQRTPLPSVVYFTHLLNSVTKMNHFSHSIHLFTRMTSLGLPLDNYIISIAIKCCCHLHRTNDAFALLGFSFRRSIVPNVFIFNTLLDGLIREDRILEAERFFEKLIKHKLCEPNVVMYSTMIKGLCKFGYNATAIRLMDERRCKPNVVTYNTIIDSICKDEMIDDALILFKEMVFRKGIAPDVVTYNILISCLCNLSLWDEASMMLKQMDDYRISPNVHTYNILVDVFCKKGKLEEAESVIIIMVDKGKEPDIVTYNSLINGYCLRGEMTKAKTILDSMLFKCIVPDVVTYTCLLNGYCKNSKIDEAMQMFGEMTRKGLQPHVWTYNVMIGGLCREGLLGDAKQLFLKMDESGCPPDSVTYRVLLQGYLNNQHFDDVESLLHAMDGRGYSLDVTTLSMLRDRIAAGSVGRSLIQLIEKLVPKGMMDKHSP